MPVTLSTTPWASSGSQTVWAPAVERSNRPCVIFCHGFAGDYSQMVALGDVSAMFASDGYTVVGHDIGGATTWANDASKTALDALVVAARGRGHGKVLLHGASMGAAVAMRYFKEAAAGRVDGVIVSVPAVDLEWMVANSGALGPNVVSAHGGAAAWATAAPLVNPARFPQYWGSKADRLMMWFSEDDTVAGNAPGFADSVRAFAAKAGVKLNSQGAVGHTMKGHDRDRILAWAERVPTS